MFTKNKMGRSRIIDNIAVIVNHFRCFHHLICCIHATRCCSVWSHKEWLHKQASLQNFCTRLTLMPWWRVYSWNGSVLKMIVLYVSGTARKLLKFVFPIAISKGNHRWRQTEKTTTMLLSKAWCVGFRYAQFFAFSILVAAITKDCFILSGWQSSYEFSSLMMDLVFLVSIVLKLFELIQTEFPRY